MKINRLAALVFSFGSLSTMPTFAQDVAGADQALRNDAAIYAKRYGVSQEEAERRIQLMVLSQSSLDEDEDAEGLDLAASYFKHDGEFAFIIESRKGAKPKKVKSFKTAKGQLSLPIEVRKSDKFARHVIERLMRDNPKSVYNTIPTAVDLAYKEVEGVLWISVDDAKAPQDLSAETAALEKTFKVPVKIQRIKTGDTRIAMPGGKHTWEKDFVLNGQQKYKHSCSTGFAGTMGGVLGMLTAGHCNTATFWSDNGSTGFTALTFKDKYTPSGDLGFWSGVPIDKQFQANIGEFRNVAIRTSVANTSVKTATKNGSFVCWFGGESGGTNAQQCGEVTSKSAKPANCSNTATVACNAVWIRLDPQPGQTYVWAGQGDSGSPVFVWNSAYGILTNSAHYFGTAQSQYVLYTSIDDAYAKGFTLAY
jgi:hypothetical protein